MIIKKAVWYDSTKRPNIIVMFIWNEQIKQSWNTDIVD